MVQEVAVAAQIRAAEAIDKVHVAAQRLTVAEQRDVFVHESHFVFVERIRVVAVDGGPLVGIERIHAVIEYDGVVFKVAAA